MTESKRNNVKKKLLEALERSLGIATPACKEVGISPKTYYEWLKTDTLFKEEVDSINETTLDFVENQLLKKVKEGSEKSIMFYMRYKARKRGYTDNINVDISGNLDLTHRIPDTIRLIEIKKDE